MSRIHHRLGFIVAASLGLTLLGAPAVGVAGGPSNPGGAASGTAAAAPLAVPAAAPGATVRTVGIGSAAAISGEAGSSVVYQSTGQGLGAYASAGYLRVPLGLPAGATVWRIDMTGYATIATSLYLDVRDSDGTTGSFSQIGSVQSSSGPGLLQAALTFSTGRTVAAGHEWFLFLSDTQPYRAFVGATVQYTGPSLAFVPIDPTRVYDSRCSGGALAGGATRSVYVANGYISSPCGPGAAGVVPLGAQAIAYNLTITGTVNNGYLSIYPFGGSTTASAINWTASGQTIANGGTVKISTGMAAGYVTVRAAGGQTQFVLDVVGYYR